MSRNSPPWRLCTTNVERSQLPSLVKEGSREAAGGSFKKINLLISTTPALRATPPHLRRGVLLPFRICCAKPLRAQTGWSFR